MILLNNCTTKLRLKPTRRLDTDTQINMDYKSVESVFIVLRPETVDPVAGLLQRTDQRLDVDMLLVDQDNVGHWGFPPGQGTIGLQDGIIT
jgi:hypothetical protein